MGLAQLVNSMIESILKRVAYVSDTATIVVLTRGRASKRKQTTIMGMPDYLRKLIVVITSPDEVEAYEQLDLGVYAVIGVPHDNIAELRHTVIQGFDEHIIMMDDNLKFHTRKPSEIGVGTKHPCKGVSPKHFTEERRGEIMLEMLEWFADQLNSDVYGMVGLSHRPTNWDKPMEPQENKRIFAIWGLNKHLYNQLPAIPWDQYPIKEDMILQLSFLTNGIPTVYSVEFAFQKSGDANSKGGCSRYRNEKMMSDIAERLASRFPGIVSVVDKKAKSWNGVDDVIKDVRVSWAKAFKQ